MRNVRKRLVAAAVASASLIAFAAGTHAAFATTALGRDDQAKLRTAIQEGDAEASVITGHLSDTDVQYAKPFIEAFNAFKKNVEENKDFTSSLSVAKTKVGSATGVSEPIKFTAQTKFNNYLIDRIKDALKVTEDDLNSNVTLTKAASDFLIKNKIDADKKDENWDYTKALQLAASLVDDTVDGTTYKSALVGQSYTFNASNPLHNIDDAAVFKALNFYKKAVDTIDNVNTYLGGKQYLEAYREIGYKNSKELRETGQLGIEYNSIVSKLLAKIEKAENPDAADDESKDADKTDETKTDDSKADETKADGDQGGKVSVPGVEQLVNPGDAVVPADKVSFSYDLSEADLVAGLNDKIALSAKVVRAGTHVRVGVDAVLTAEQKASVDAGNAVWLDVAAFSSPVRVGRFKVLKDAQGYYLSVNAPDNLIKGKHRLAVYSIDGRVLGWSEFKFLADTGVNAAGILAGAFTLALLAAGTLTTRRFIIK